MNNDVALVRLKGNGFNITRDVQPICLPSADFSDEVGMNCTISGFGSVHSGRAGERFHPKIKSNLKF